MDEETASAFHQAALRDYTHAVEQYTAAVMVHVQERVDTWSVNQWRSDVLAARRVLELAARDVRELREQARSSSSSEEGA